MNYVIFMLVLNIMLVMMFIISILDEKFDVIEKSIKWLADIYTRIENRIRSL